MNVIQLLSGKPIAYAFVLISLLLLVENAWSSGSHSAFQWSESYKYDLGKKVFLQKIVCAACPYADLEQNREQVAGILSEIEFDKDLGKPLSILERESLRHFLRKRFNLKS